MDERRAFPRIKTDERVCRVGQEGDAANSNNFAISDINHAGLCFISPQEIQPGTILKLHLSLPFSYQPELRLYHLAKVMYCNREGDGERFRIGCYNVHPNKRG